MQHQCGGLLPAVIAFLGIIQCAIATRARRHDTTISYQNGTLKSLVQAAPSDNFDKETPIIWVDKSVLPLSVELLIALAWITMVAAVPLVALGIEFRTITKTQISMFVTMWITFIGGIYLFTNVLLFQSSHFETVRSLTIVECVYLMSQIITTVGYGDITPAKPRGQVFVGLYVLFALLVIANVVTDVAALVASHTQKSFQSLEDMLPCIFVKNVSGESSEVKDPAVETAKQWVPNSPPRLPWKEFLRSLALYLSCCVAGYLFFVWYPGEGKTHLEGIYMTVITLSTVGFGAVTPVTAGGKVFGAFWMLFGSAALVGLAKSFMELTIVLRRQEHFDHEKASADSRRFLEATPQQFDAGDFLRLGLLHTKALQEEEMEQLVEAFSMLKPDADGTVSKGEVQKLFTIAMQTDE